MNRAGREKAAQYWAQSQVIQVWQGHLLATAGALELKSSSDYSEADIKIYLGEIAGKHFFAVHKEIAEGAGQTLREIAGLLDEVQLEIAVTSLALINWHESHPRCPRCGNETEVTANGWVRKCIVDGSQHFPRTDPAIIVAVQDRAGRICLGRQAIWPEGRYSNFAGFVEPGESLEDAVIREVEEESGLQVRDIRYLYSQPWPFPNSIMLAYEAFTDNPELAKPDGEEIVDLKWFTKDALRSSIADGSLNLPPVTSVSRKMIERWLNG
jgi:NAD+ diphosphatase